jgi:hypothetical protein
MRDHALTLTVMPAVITTALDTSWCKSVSPR